MKEQTLFTIVGTFLFIMFPMAFLFRSSVPVKQSILITVNQAGVVKIDGKNSSAG